VSERLLAGWPRDGRFRQPSREPQLSAAVTIAGAERGPVTLFCGVQGALVWAATVDAGGETLAAAVTSVRLGAEDAEALLRRMGLGPAGHARLGWSRLGALDGDAPLGARMELCWLYSDDAGDVDTDEQDGLGGLGYALNLTDPRLSEWGLHPFAMSAAREGDEGAAAWD
jgi:hypothetical protein